MAWMNSTSGTSKGQWFLTGEFTVDRLRGDRTAAEGVSAVLGFQSSPATHEQVRAEIARVDARRAALVADVTTSVVAALMPRITAELERLLADVGTGPGSPAEVDLQPVLDAVASVPAATATELATRLTPTPG